MKAIGTLSDFPLNEQKIIDLEDEYVLVLRTPTGFWAIEDRCSHDDNELFGGEVVGKEPDLTSSPVRRCACLRFGRCARTTLW
jgi:nitrite reductase/ring-hydroxylating ferredoxin subunit